MYTPYKLKSPQEETKEMKEMKTLCTKLNLIDEKSKCGSVRFLDLVANLIENGGSWIATKIRSFNMKISAPCSISFTKKK